MAAKRDFLKILMRNKKFVFLIIIAFILGITIRAMHYRWDLYNSDEAIVGVMGIHILSGNDFPVFNYGISYIGSLEAYLAAFMFKLFGISVLSHNLVLIIFTAIYCFAMYSLSVRLFESRKAGLLTLVFTLVCPSFLGFWNLQAIGGYTESLTFGTLIFVLVHRIVWKDDRRAGIFLVFGLLAGIAWWTGGFVVYYILPAVFFFFIKDKLIFFRRNFWITAAGFFAGSSPFWIYRFQTDFDWRLFFSPQQTKFSFHVLTDLVRYALPHLLSIGPCSLSGKIFSSISYIVEVIFFMALLSLAWKYRKGFFSMMRLSIRGTKGPELIFVFVITSVLLYAVSRYPGLHRYRVLLPLYTAIPMLFAFFVISLEKRSKLLAYITAGIILFFSLYSTLCYSIEALRQGTSIKDRFGAPPVDKLTRHLMETGVSKCYAGERLHFKITFASRGKIKSIRSFKGRYQPYVEILNAECAPVLVLREHQAGKPFIDTMKSLCSSFDMEKFEEFVIFRNFRRPEENLIEFSPETWKSKVSRNTDSAAFVYDRNISTKWSPGKPQRAGEYFQLDLGGIKKIRKIVIIIDSFDRTNFLRVLESPLGFDLELSGDGNNWKKAFHLPDYGAAGCVFWSDCRPFWKAYDGRMELFLPEAMEARYIKLVLTNNHHAYRWVIDEIFVYGMEESEEDEESSSERVRREETPHEKLLEFLMKHRIKKIYAGYWLSSWIYLASGKKIGYIPPYNPMEYPGKIKPDRVIDFWEDTAFAIEKENAASIEKTLNSSGISYSRKEIGKYRVYYDLKRGKSECGVKLKPSGWKASTSNPGMDGRNAFDGDLSTRWGTGAPQKPGMYYELDMGRSYILKRVSFCLGKFETDFPRGYNIEVSENGKNWEKLEEEDGWDREFFWGGTHLLKFHRPGIDFRCKPTSVRFIRVSLTGHDDHFDFSIAEIEIRVKGNLL